MITPDSKILTKDSLIEWREKLRASGKKLVFTNGCFDILHKGHVEYLFKARNQGDALIVAMNSDESVRAIKGPTRPINPEDARAIVLASLYFVDGIYLFSSPRCCDVIKEIEPDIYVKGADYTLDTLDREEKAVLLDLNVDIRFIEFTPGFSTTAIIAKSQI